MRSYISNNWSYLSEHLIFLIAFLYLYFQSFQSDNRTDELKKSLEELDCKIQSDIKHLGIQVDGLDIILDELESKLEAKVDELEDKIKKLEIKLGELDRTTQSDIGYLEVQINAQYVNLDDYVNLDQFDEKLSDI